MNPCIWKPWYSFFHYSKTRFGYRDLAISHSLVAILDLCKLAFSHAEIMQMSKEIIVLKDIMNGLKHLKTSGNKLS